ncbi:molybdopterin-dependent oxidoreductase [Paenibacillus athensensis]|uniref:Oxidoreductase n=1 Tax=Paenibacillus athensensis TaxID=1967502 RepID=A0A4Y8PXT3_9BACL|nr:molybdopterin-dependent oxidoreductase [Paenibacillus athensensis]MCD1259942.1 molybdopterin-dependent oxidoreductase [Paenibacillus athensensis]
MEAKKGWFKQTLGKRLNSLHTWNAWVVVVLAISGVVLSIGAIRGELGAFRVTLKQLHIGFGLISIVLLVLYAPLLRKHWKQLRGRSGQRGNLLLVLGLLLGWSLSGLVLWQYRNLPSMWNNTALLIHDLLTWIGIPYALYHSISRSRWLKRRQREEQAAAAAAARAAVNAEQGAAARAEQIGKENEIDSRVALPVPDASASATDSGDTERSAANAVIAALKCSSITRASFLRLVAGLVLLLGVGPAFYRWLKGIGAFSTESLDTPTESAVPDGNHMLPAPEPLPESAAVVGGGAKGRFRVYTVTEIPAFSSDSWKFAIAGLVDRPMAWSWEQFLQMKRTVQVSDFHCITGWSVYQLTWEGIPLKQLLAEAGVQSKAKYVKFYSGDQVYTDALSLEQAALDDVMVAVLMDGKPIPQKLGGPVRLVVPKMYAYKSVKWLQGIELIEEEHIGYWEVRGYDNDAWVKRG